MTLVLVVYDFSFSWKGNYIESFLCFFLPARFSPASLAYDDTFLLRSCASAPPTTLPAPNEVEKDTCLLVKFVIL